MPNTSKKTAPKAATVAEKTVEAPAKEVTAATPAVSPAPKAEKPKKESKPKSTKKTADKPKAEKKTASAKTPAKKTAAKSAPAKKSASAAKSIKPDEFKIQCNGDFTMEEITEKCVEAYKGNSKKQVKSISVYLKAENGGIRVYYVVNGKSEGLYIDL